MRLLNFIAWTGIIMAVLLIGLFLLSKHYFGFAMAQTMLFSGFVVYEFVRLINIKHQHEESFFDNKWLPISVFFALILQLVVLYTPLNGVFNVVPLGLVHWAMILGTAIAGFFISIAVRKLIIMRIKEE